MVGLFINTLPVRVALRPGRDARRVCSSACRPSRPACSTTTTSGWPTSSGAAGPGAGFDTLTVFESYPVDRAGLTDRDRHRRHARHRRGCPRRRPLPAESRRLGDASLHLKFEYVPELFDRTPIEDIADRVVRVLTPRSTDRAAGRSCRCSPTGSAPNWCRSAAVPAAPSGRCRRSSTTRPRSIPARSHCRPGTARCPTGNWTNGPTSSRVLYRPRTRARKLVALGIPRSIESVLSRVGGGQDRGRVRAGRPELPGRAHRAHAHRFRVRTRVDHVRAPRPAARAPRTGWRSTTPELRDRVRRAAPADRSTDADRTAPVTLDTAAYARLHVGVHRQAEGRGGHPPRSRQFRPRPARPLRCRYRSPGRCTSPHRASTARSSSTCRRSVRRDDGDRAAHRLRSRRS